MTNNFPHGAPMSFGGQTVLQLADSDNVALIAGSGVVGKPTASRNYFLPSLATTNSGARIEVSNVGTFDILVLGLGADSVNEVGSPGALSVLAGTTATFEAKGAVGGLAGSWYASFGGTILPSFMFASRGSSQTADIGVNDNVIIQFNNGSRGSDITLNGTTGIFTLQPGLRYKATADLGEMDFSGITGRAEAQWYNITQAGFEGRSALAFDNQNTATAGSANSALGTFAPSTVQEIELRIKVATAVTGFGTTAVPCMAYIEVI